MRRPRWIAAVAAVVSAAALVAGAALAVGPWPGLAASISSPSGDVRYTAVRAGGTTTVRAIRNGTVIASARIAGAFGIPAVTSLGGPGGLSPDGRLLVLVQPPDYNGLRAKSRFVVLSTGRLTRAATIALPGEFGFDAVSPDRRTLYVIQHVSANDLVRYVVRAYDLASRRLLPKAIVDERNPGEVMRGYPVARAATPSGDWVYTLYTKNPGSSLTFVHALNAAGRSAFCIDVPSSAFGGDVWAARLELSGDTLLVKTKAGTPVARIDTTTLRVL
ncbi:MAG: hypothetical protein ACM3QU_09985 [Verrucomicrobiota bacterium]